MENAIPRRSLADRLLPVDGAVYEGVAYRLLMLLVWLPILQSPVYVLHSMEGGLWSLNIAMLAIAYVYLAAFALFLLFALWFLASRLRALPARRGSLTRVVRERALTPLWCAFLLLALVSTLRADDVSQAFRGHFQRADGYYSYLGYAAVLLAASCVHTKEKRASLLKNFAWMILLCAALALCQQFAVPVISVWFPLKCVAFFRNLNHFGYLLTMAVLIAAGGLYVSPKRWQRALCGAALCFLLFVLFYNNTLGCHVAVLCAFVLTALLYKPALGCRGARPFLPLALYTAVFALVLLPTGRFACPFVTDNVAQIARDINELFGGAAQQATAAAPVDDIPQAAGRIMLWKFTLGLIAQKPLLGWGAENIGQFFTEAGMLFSDSPHNEYLNLTAYYGIPAALCCYGAQIWLFVRRVRGVRTIGRTTLVALGAAFAYAVSAFFGVSMVYAASYYYLLLGLVLGGEGQNETLA